MKLRRLSINEMRCAILYHLYKLKNVNNNHGRVLLKVALLHGYFSRFLNCANVTKSRKASQLVSTRKGDIECELK